MKRLAVFGAMVLVMLATRAAFAQGPIFVEPRSNVTRATAFKITDDQTSWVVYAQLTQPGEVNYYTFDGARGDVVYISANLPKTDEATQFGVEIALIGNAIAQTDAVPFPLNANEHALVMPDPGHDPASVFLEPTTQTAYWTRQSARVTLPGDGAYLIAVYNAQNKTGKYVLTLGGRAEWGMSDVPMFPNVWISIQSYFGKINFAALGIGALIVVTVITAGTVYFFLRK
ncbi:MAG: hypothetical protein HY868_11280 [Chloroflexi bacterium]|nr:hypothetical protein [Chloroflexota bacterium]